jgi:DNA-binding GntR family transcriptional regulator
MPQVSRNPGSESEHMKNESPVDIAFRRIKEMLYHHEIVPGQKLLYQELAKRLGMSITPVIQALNRLQLLNIVYSERNKGYYVGEADPVEAKELFMALEALQIYLVPMILANLDEKKLNAVEKAMKEHVQALSVPQYRRSLMIKDTNFHLEIIKCADNKVIYTICQQIFERIYLKYRPEYLREERIRDATEEHRMLLQALKEKDEKKTIRMLKKHTRNAIDYVVDTLTQDRTIDFEIS